MTPRDRPPGAAFCPSRGELIAFHGGILPIAALEAIGPNMSA